MIALTLYLHYKDTYGDRYSVDARIDRDGDVALTFKHQRARCHEAEEVDVYLHPEMARGLRDRLTELLGWQPEVAAQPEALPEVQQVAEPI